MPIPLKEDDVITIPAKTTPEVKAEIMWVLRIISQFPGPAYEGSFVLEYCAMTAEGVLIQRGGENGFEDLTKRMETQEFFADAAKCPELQAIQDAIVNGTPAIQAYLDKKAADKAEAGTPVNP